MAQCALIRNPSCWNSRTTGALQSVHSKGIRGHSRLASKTALANVEVVARRSVVQFRNAQPRRRLALTVRSWEKPWEATTEESPYSILGISNAASSAEVKSAYRSLSKKYHPDVAQTQDSDEQSTTEQFIRIQAAYDLLMDEERRRQYDRDHRQSPLASNLMWMEYVEKRKKAFNQRGDQAATTWQAQNKATMSQKQRYWEQKGEEEVRKQTRIEQKKVEQKWDTTTKHHMLVMKKREKERQAKDAERAKEERLLAMNLLLEEGFELDE